MIPVGFSPSRLRPRTTVSRLAPATIGEVAALLLRVDDGVGRDDRLPVGEGFGLRDLRHLGDADGEVAVGDGDRGDLHVVADDHRARALVDHDLGRLFRLDR